MASPKRGAARPAGRAPGIAGRRSGGADDMVGTDMGDGCCGRPSVGCDGCIVNSTRVSARFGFSQSDAQISGSSAELPSQLIMGDPPVV